MSKKRWSLAVAAAVLVFGGFGVYSAMQDPYADLEVSSSPFADYEYAKSIERVEQFSEIVVVGTFTGGRERVKRGDEYLEIVRSMVRVEKVIKGEHDLAGKTLVNTVIPVFEECYVREDRVYVTNRGYKWMNEDGRYLLFLAPNGRKDAYLISGNFQGKYDLNLKERGAVHRSMKDAFHDPKVEFMGEGFEWEDFYEMKAEAIRVYKL